MNPFYESLVPKKMISGTEHGQVEKPVRTLSHGGETLEQTSLRISKEYSKLVQDFPDYDFTIIADNDSNTLRITWKKRT